MQRSSEKSPRFSAEYTLVCSEVSGFSPRLTRLAGGLWWRGAKFDTVLRLNIPEATGRSRGKRLPPGPFVWLWYVRFEGEVVDDGDDNKTGQSFLNPLRGASSVRGCEEDTAGQQSTE